MQRKYIVNDRSVINSRDNSVVCTVSSYDASQERKKVRHINTVRLNLTNSSLIEMATNIIQAIQDNPNAINSSGFTYYFAFPYYGGNVLGIEFSGQNMNEDAYDIVTYLVADEIANLIGLYIKYSKRSASAKQKLQAEVDEIRNCLAVVYNVNQISYNPGALKGEAAEKVGG
jgi:hypothetical protein